MWQANGQSMVGSVAEVSRGPRTGGKGAREWSGTRSAGTNSQKK